MVKVSAPLLSLIGVWLVSIVQWLKPANCPTQRSSPALRCRRRSPHAIQDLPPATCIRRCPSPSLVFREARDRTGYGQPGAVRTGQEIDPDTELFYDTGTASFGVYRSDNTGSNLATAARLVVDDFDAAHAALVSRGVVFEEYDLDEEFRTVDGILVSPDGEKTCWFKDSEGNILAVASSV